MRHELVQIYSGSIATTELHINDTLATHGIAGDIYIYMYVICYCKQNRIGTTNEPLSKYGRNRQIEIFTM